MRTGLRLHAQHCEGARTVQDAARNHDRPDEGCSAAFIRQHREQTAEQWLKRRLDAFWDTPQATDLNNFLQLHLQRLEAALSPCPASCQHCYLTCVAVGIAHESWNRPRMPSAVRILCQGGLSRLQPL
jgi:hypothetical protein